jgi:hypothetical protein
MTVIYTVISILGLSALFGMYLLSLILRNKATPTGIAMIHGLLAATGVILLIIQYFKNSPGLLATIIILVLAASGGAILVYRDVTGKTVPKWAAVGHGITAVIGFVTLLVFAFA